MEPDAHFSSTENFLDLFQVSQSDWDLGLEISLLVTACH
jgi:hypothetical protein